MPAKPLFFYRIATAVALLCTALSVHAETLVKPDNVAAPPVAEDMVTIPGSDWVLVSGISIGKAAQPGIYAMRRLPLHLEKLSFDIAAAADRRHCSTLEEKAFSPLGITVGRDGDRNILLVINRGGRAAIERFRVDGGSGKPRLTWEDCIPIPSEVSANSLSLLPTGDIYITQTYDPADKESWQRRVDGEDTGRLFHWSPRDGWQAAPVKPMSGPNGLVVSDDGCFAVVAAWSGSELVRQSLPCASTEEKRPDKSLALSFMPDNLRWTSAGTVLATGQHTTPNGLLDCVKGKGECPSVLTVVEVDPASMKIVQKWRVDAGNDLGLATTALQVGEEIWVSSILGHRIARFPYQPAQVK